MASHLPIQPLDVTDVNLSNGDQNASRKIRPSTDNSEKVLSGEQDHLPGFKASPPEPGASHDELESSVTVLPLLETQNSNESNGSDTVELQINATKTVKRRDAQQEKSTIIRNLSEEFTNVTVGDKQQPTQSSGSLAAPAEAEETGASQDLVIENQIHAPIIMQPSIEHPAKYSTDAVSTSDESVTYVVGDSLFTKAPYEQLTFPTGPVKLFADLCDGLQCRGFDLTPLYQGLKYLLDKLNGQGSITQSSPHAGNTVTVMDVLKIVGQLQVTTDSYFVGVGRKVSKHLSYLLTKSWMIFGLTHSKSERSIRAFCSMCLETHEKEVIGSHVYSKGLLTAVCGQSNKNTIWIALSKPPKTPASPNDCKWCLECSKCDRGTSNIEISFIDTFKSGHYDKQSELDMVDAVLFHIYALRGLQVNVDLVHHCFFCCRGYVSYLLAFFDRALEYHYTLKSYNKGNPHMDMKKEASRWVLFCTKSVTDRPDFLTEFPLLCQIDLHDISPDLLGRICLIYGQITNSCRVEEKKGYKETKNHLCWAIPLVSDVTAVDNLRPRFSQIVDYVNKWLQQKRTKYFESIDQDEPQDLKLVVGYLKTCV